MTIVHFNAKPVDNNVVNPCMYNHTKNSGQMINLLKQCL